MLYVYFVKNRFRHTQTSPNDWSEVRDILVKSCGSVSMPSYLDCCENSFEVHFNGCSAEFLAIKVLSILIEKIRQSDFCYIHSFRFEPNGNKIVQKGS